MLYFIPSWYDETGNSYCKYDPPWYRPIFQREADETVKYLRLLRQGEVTLLSLGYQPQLRHWLHRQGIYGVSIWSCFDAILHIERSVPEPFSFRQLPWREDISFVYTDFAVIAVTDEGMEATIDFGPDGNMIYVDTYQKDVLCERTHMDDRGFASSVIRYQDGAPLCQEFYNERQECRLRLSFDDGSVTIQGSPDYTLEGREGRKTLCFSQRVYRSVEDLILEVTLAYLRENLEDAAVCVALSWVYERLICSLPSEMGKIITWYQGRCRPEEMEALAPIIAHADAVVVDAEETARQLSSQTDAEIFTIPPDPTDELALGHTRIPPQNLLVLVDNLDDQMLSELLTVLAGYAAENAGILVTLLTQSRDSDRATSLMEQVDLTLKTIGQQKLRGYFRVEHCCDEAGCVHIFRQQRILIDLSTTQDGFLHTLALACGLPQLVGRPTPYVVPKENGRVLTSLEELPAALDFYMKDLSHWNHAVAASEALGKGYTESALIKKWNEVLAAIGSYPDFTIRDKKLGDGV